LSYLVKIKVLKLTYSDVVVLEEKAIEEPHNSIYGQREGQTEGHKFHALRLYDTFLHVSIIRV